MIRAPRALGWVLLVALSVVPLVATSRAVAAGDLPLYFHSAKAWLSGRTPYAQLDFEYPPYALLAFAPAAAVSSTEREFQLAFALELALFDGAAKLMLLWAASRRRGFWAYAPFLAYCALGYVHGFWHFKRFDLIPAAFTLAAVLALARGRGLWGGVALGLGIGVKVYPVVLLPVLAAHAFTQRKLKALSAGLALALLPLAALGLSWPFWRAGSFHSARGLQVESLWASLLWLGREWTGVKWWPGAAAYELRDGLATTLLPIAASVWGLASLSAAAVSARAIFREPEQDFASLAAKALAPLVAFITFSPVISPQYLVWIAVLAALLLDPVRWRTAAILFAAAVLTRLTYPAPGYDTGLSLGYTLTLVTRNLLLVAGLGGLLLPRGEPRPQNLPVSLR